MGNFTSRIQMVNRSLINLNRVTFVTVFTVTACLVSISLNILYSFVNERDIIWFDFPGFDDGVVLMFFLAVIFAPPFETWLGQSLPYRLLNKVQYLKDRSYLVLVIGAVWFGINHFYSLFYMIYGFLIGLVFMYGYMVRIKTDKKTFYLISICHSLINLMIFIKNLV